MLSSVFSLYLRAMLTCSFPFLSLCVCVCVSGSNCLPTLSRFAVIDLSAGPCTYGKIETEEGSVSSRTLPRLQHMIFPGGYGPVTGHSTSDIFIGQLASLISTTIEHVIAPDVRYFFYILMFPSAHITFFAEFLLSFTHELYSHMHCWVIV